MAKIYVIHENDAWVEPLRAPFRDAEILEMPPPTQGISACSSSNAPLGPRLPWPRCPIG